MYVVGQCGSYTGVEVSQISMGNVLVVKVEVGGVVGYLDIFDFDEGCVGL